MKLFSRDKRPKVKPIVNIELDRKHLPLRVVLFVGFLVLGIGLIVYSLTSWLSEDVSGWHVVEAQASATPDCSDEFELLYEFGQSDISGKNEYNALSALYGQATAKAYQLFHESREFSGVRNIAYLNAHPGESVEVDAVLYDALSLMIQSGGRQLYLAPVYEYYEQLFRCKEDFETFDYDPAQNDELAALFTEILAFANDPDAISLQLQGEGKVCLHISDAYRDFAEANDVYTFIGFHWTKNAFIADYLASTLIENGYTHGSISSIDGFSRNLDDRGMIYALNLFDRVGNTICTAGTLAYSGQTSLVTLRSFPVNASDNGRYYVMSGGETRFPYLDPADGLCRAAQSNLVCYSQSAGCAEILLRMIPVYITDSFDPVPLAEAEGIEAVYCRDKVIRYTAESADIVCDEDNGYTTERLP